MVLRTVISRKIAVIFLPLGRKHSVAVTVTVNQAPTYFDTGFAVGKETLSCDI